MKRIVSFLKSKPFILYRYTELNYSTIRLSLDRPLIHILYRALRKSVVVHWLDELTQGKSL